MSPPSDSKPAPGWDAATYHKVSDPQHSWGMELAGRFDWRGDETVLDAGCGSGRVAAELLELIPRGRLIAVDADADMIARARETLAGPLADGRAQLHHCNLLEFSAPTPVDVVFSNAVFHWIADHDRLWRQCHDWLRPGGWVWAQCGGVGNVRAAMDLASKLASGPDYASKIGKITRGHYFATPEQTEQRLLDEGFTDIVTGLENKETQFDSEQVFEVFIKTVILRHYQSRLGPELFDRFVKSWLEIYLKDRGPRLDYVRLNVRARKKTKPGGRAESRSS